MMKLWISATQRCWRCHHQRLVASNPRMFSGVSLFSKTEEHDALRSMLRTFVRREVGWISNKKVVWDVSYSKLSFF